MKIIFLVYDSRSGSTLLSKKISESFQDVFVTQEIGLDSFLGKYKKGIEKKNILKMIPKMYNSKKKDLINYPIKKDFLMDKLRTFRHLDARRFIEIFLLEIVKDENKTIVVKNGSHVKYLKELQCIFGNDLNVIHIYRDPRAVISSKLKSKRPYHSHETMAWGGSIFASLQWNYYIDSIFKKKESQLNLINISYEDFVDNPNNSIVNIAKIFDLSLSETCCGNAYNVPNKESEIHKLYDQEIKTSRIVGWKKELEKDDLNIIEMLCSKNMKLLGYQKYCNKKSIKFFSFIKKFPDLFLRIWIHVSR